MVEHLEDGKCHVVSSATAQHVEANRFLVTITDVPHWVRMTALDGAPLRIHGREAFRVWGTRKVGTTLVLDVLVH